MGADAEPARGGRLGRHPGGVRGGHGDGGAPHPGARAAQCARQGRAPEGFRHRHPVGRPHVHALRRRAPRFHQHPRHRLHVLGRHRGRPCARARAARGHPRGEGLRDGGHPVRLRRGARGRGAAAFREGLVMFRPRAADDKMPFMEHLGELRIRIMRSLYALLAGLVVAFPFSERITDFLARPVTKLGYKLVFTAPAEAFWVQMKVALITALFISSPGILWQVWAFIAPGLHTHERKYAAPFVIIGSLMFIAGGAFALLVVTPYAIAFLLSYARDTLQPMITLENHVGFILKFTLAFGLVFELPLILTLLSRMGVVTPKTLARNRKYAVLGAFITAAILTPTPDAFNQSLMAGPLILLYEVGIVCARVFGRRRADAVAQAEAGAATP